jgi:Zn-dependent protease with chaperone function/Tfp pilus assembly major pilin PilA
VKDELVYPREVSLGAITLVFGLIGWLLLVVGTFGLALVYLLVGFVFYVFAHSAFISWLRGNAVLLSQAQLPDLRARFEACCTRLGLEEMPEAYLMQGGGALNAFATRFLGRNYVVLLSDIVDAMEEHPDGVNFYFGHELGHIRRHHLTGNLLRAPVLWLPLIGAAYSRAKESTCDRHGRACCASPESAARALVALAAGARRWRQVDLPTYAGQAALSTGFWMSFHELINGYPWMTKRTARVLDPAAPVPRRNPLAWLLALFVPYAGRAGGGFGGVIIVVAVIGVLAAVALPAYQDYTVRARLTGAYLASEPVRQALGDYFVKHDKEAPASLQEAGLPTTLADGSTLAFDADQMVLTVETPNGDLVFVPENLNDPKLVWRCIPGEGVKRAALPAACRDEAAAPPR